MLGNRQKLRIFYLFLCGAQLLVTGMGLAVAYQVQRSYARNIDDEKAVNEEHRAVNELETLARVVAPGSLSLEDDTVPSQISETTYTAKLFLRKAQDLLNESVNSPKSPVARSRSDLKALVSEMNMVAAQSQSAGEAWQQRDLPLARARLTYADRAAARVQAILGNINLEMSKTKDEVLLSESAEARRASLLVRPLAFLGILMLLPALLYARRLDRNIWAYEAELEDQRNFLEHRVATRTSELLTEIHYRKRMEIFNDGRNRLMEKVVEGMDLQEVLSELARMTELSVEDSQCLILLDRGDSRSVISAGVSPAFASTVEKSLLERWDTVRGKNPEDAVFLADYESNARLAFIDVWSHGFRGILAGPITQQQQPVLGVIALLLRKPRDPGAFAREILLSASRMASVALEHARMQGELFRRAHHDPLTNLPNRALFEDRLQHAVALAERRTSNVGVLCIDLDGFKLVNDRYGHQAGDWLLQEVAKRLTSHLRKTDTVARLGGDEFVAVVHDAHGGEGVAKFSEALVQLIGVPYTFGNITLNVTASIGAALYPKDGESAGDLMRNADVAMYRAKELGHNTYQMFSADLGEGITRRKQIGGQLKEALERSEFELFYQPIYTVARTLVGFEALIRFRRPDLKSISPGEFIPVAEQTGQILQIGEWVLREACRQAKRWQDEGFAPVPIAVNVSAIQLARLGFARQVEQILQDVSLQSSWLHVEITETAVMSDFEEVQRQLDALARLGVHISIDDFGTGHSSLSYIHRMPIKILKIDRSFVRNMIESQESKAIVHAIIAMAKSLGLTVVAEGVETEKQLEALGRANCDLVQGYLFARPLDTQSARGLLVPQSSSVLDPVSS